MDNVDKRLLSILQKNGRTSLSEIGKDLGMSHVAVSKRLDKLVNGGLVKVTAGVNAEAVDMKLLMIGLETESINITDKLMEKYKNCPRLMMLAPVTGRYNLFAVMAVEDTWTLESIIGTCSLRTEAGVRRSESWFGNAPIFPEYVSVNLAPAKKKSTKAPCGQDCAGCNRYIIEKCVGCPATSAYKGSLWASPLTKSRRKGKS